MPMGLPMDQEIGRGVVAVFTAMVLGVTAINTNAVPPLPNFQTCGESYGPVDMAVWDRSNLKILG